MYFSKTKNNLFQILKLGMGINTLNLFLDYTIKNDDVNKLDPNILKKSLTDNIKNYNSVDDIEFKDIEFTPLKI